MCLLINKSQNNLISNIKIAKTFFDRFKGLMFKKNIVEGLILKIPKSKYRYKSSIHMFFMRSALDILFIDDKNIIFEMVTISPWNIYTPKKPAKYVIELKKGCIEKKRIAINDEIEIIKLL
jgi:uncharacterized membrane protein (UPF0127 family)